jgi:hypothetical protein
MVFVLALVIKKLLFKANIYYFAIKLKQNNLGGPLTITDANLCLNRLLPNYFPKIFGKTQDRPLDTKATKYI